MNAIGTQHDSLAQLVEHLTLNQQVRGSSPRWVTIGNERLPEFFGGLFYVSVRFNRRINPRENGSAKFHLTKLALLFILIVRKLTNIQQGANDEERNDSGLG